MPNPASNDETLTLEIHWTTHDDGKPGLVLQYRGRDGTDHIIEVYPERRTTGLVYVAHVDTRSPGQVARTTFPAACRYAFEQLGLVLSADYATRILGHAATHHVSTAVD